MKILVAYATNSGSTYLTSEQIVGSLKTSGHDVAWKKIKETEPDEIASYEVVLFGSPSWWVNKKDGQPHEDFFEFMEKAKEHKFPKNKFAIFGLGDRGYTHFCGAVDVLEEFIKNIEGELVVPSMRIDGYYFNPDQNEKQITDWVTKLAKTL